LLIVGFTATFDNNPSAHKLSTYRTIY